MVTREHYARINEGLALYNRGEAWLAHEAWEAVWLEAQGIEKAVLQALIQTAAAVHKHQQGVHAGATRNMEKALGNLGRAAGRGCCFGIDMVALEARIRRSLAAASAGAFSVPRLPEHTGPDGFLYLHGFASSPRSFKASQIVPAIEARGWSVATPDLNEDDFSGLTISRALNRARRHLRDRTIIVGSSLGGYLAALLQQGDERVVATVLMAPAFDFVERMRQKYGPQALEDWAREDFVEVDHYGQGRPAAIGYGLISDATEFPGRPCLTVPTFVLQGARDDVVPAPLVAETVSAAPNGLVQYVEVDDDHTLGGSVDRAIAAAVRFGEQFEFASDAALTS